ncbi:MAG: DUF3179 domain-containing protein [Bacteroidota bacterium]
MNKISFLLLLLSISLAAQSCQENDNETASSPTDTEWLIPIGEVRDGGPGKDGIPSIDEPRFVMVEQNVYLDDNDLVLVHRVGSDIHIYPHPILDWHEIVNDDFDNSSIAITYCPLTGTAVGWNRILEGKRTTFGVSGLLYNSNLIPYDRDTDSNWSQMRLDCVNGELAGKDAETYQLLETTWANAAALFPDAQVLSTNTGFDRDYSRYPYGSYRNDASTIFPVDNAQDERLFAKERVLGIISGDEAKAYRFSSFGESRVIRDSFGGKDYVIVGEPNKSYMMAFIAEEGRTYVSRSNTEDPTIVMEDDLGNQIDILGRVISGPNRAQELEHAKAFVGFWFAWAAFYDRIPIFE